MQTEKNIWLKVLSMILTLALLISCVPNQVYAMAGEALADLLEATDTAVLQPGTTSEFTLSTARIVSEDTSRRGEFYKEYIMNNGLRYATVYPSAIHYEEDGQWKDIDNTLVAAISGGKSVYQNKAGAWNVRFPQSLSGNDMIGITKDGFTVQFGMAGEMRSSGDLVVASIGQIGTTADTLAISSAQTVTAQIQQIDLTAARAAAEHPETILDKLNSRLTYANVYPNTDVVYDLQGNQLKESVVLQRYDASLWGYRYTLDTGDLIPVLREDQQIDLCHPETNEAVLTMPAPYMLDNNGEISYDVEVMLTRNGSTYLLSYYLPRAWLADTDRAWPVILDPIINGNSHYTNVKDVTVAETQTESSTHGVMQCGYSTSCGAMRIYMQYINLPPLTSGNVIVDATISLNKPMNSGTTSNVDVHKVTGSWDSTTITWANKANYESNIADYVVCRDAGWYTWNITNIVRDWYEDEDNNYGVVFKVPDSVETESTANTWKQFYSSDFSTSADTMPVLSITYQNHNGLEDYWSYSSSSAGRAGTGYVNLFTGNLVWVRNDLGFDGNRMPVSISHIYNANDSQTNKFGMGFGWRTNYNQTIKRPDEDTVSEDNIFVWEDGDGTSHYFYPAKDSGNNVISNTYLDEDGLHLTLTTGGSGDQTYQLTDQLGNKSYFDASGRLRKIENNQETKSNNTITYTTDTGNLISTITDGVGRVYCFDYYDSGLLRRISFLDAYGEECAFVSYEYTGGNLTKITDNDSQYTTYAYNTHRLLTTVQDVTNYCVTYSYAVKTDDKPFARVTEVSERQGDILGNSVGFTYSVHYTKTEDQKNHPTYYQFNDWGNLIAAYDASGHVQYTRYALNDKNDPVSSTAEKNQVIEISNMSGTSSNTVPNSSFEDGEVGTMPSGWSSPATISDTQKYRGGKSMRLSTAANNEVTNTIGPSVDVGPGESCTFSAYIYCEDGANFTLAIVGSEAGEIFQNGLGDSSNGWMRFEVSYTNEGDEAETVSPKIIASTGTVYIDCIQMEKASAASPYNAVENGDFSAGNTDGWTKSDNCTSSDTYSEAENAANLLLSSGSLYLEGKPGTLKCYQQEVTISGEAGDAFVLSGWAKANALPSAAGREFGLKLIFHTSNLADGEDSVHYVSFDPEISGNNWQYAAMTAITDTAFVGITIMVLYSDQENWAYFDGIQLYEGSLGTVYTYDEHKNVKYETNALDQTTEYIYDEDNNVDLVRIEMPEGRIISYEYDSYHNVTEMEETITDPSGTEHTTIYKYDYNAHGSVRSVTVEQKLGDQLDAELTQKTVNTYTLDGNYLASTTDGNGETTTYGYNSETGVLMWVQYPEDTAATRTEYVYDEMYRLKETKVKTDQVDQNGDTVEMSAGYTYENDLLKKIMTRSTTYNFTYGKLNLCTSVKVGNQALATYEYTDHGELKKLTYGNGDRVEYQYDTLGRVVAERYYEADEPNGMSRFISYVYTNGGTLAMVNDDALDKEIYCQYDSAGRVWIVLEVKDHNVQRMITYSYDSKGNISKILEETNDLELYTQYLYDYKNRIQSVKTNDAQKGYSYDDLDRLMTETVSKVESEGENQPEIITEVFTSTYDYYTATVGGTAVTTNQVKSKVTTTPTNQYQNSLTYEYDGNGNITSISNGDEDAPLVITYEYDSANQLIRENNPYANYTWVWTYDDAGNIQSRKEYAYTTVATAQLGSPIKTYAYGYGNSGWGDLLTSYDGRDFIYDGSGNLTDDDSWTYTWKQGRQLASMTNGTIECLFEYDANGMRTKCEIGLETYTYVYTGTQLTEMTSSLEHLRFTYDAEGRPLTMEYHPVEHTGDTCGPYCGIYYYVTNLQGDVIALLDSSGNVNTEYFYDAWGNPIDIPGAAHGFVGNINPLRYRGYVYDRHTGLYYLQSRYYNPEIGRFINADAYVSTGQGILGNNMFAYCGNNPVINIDSNGEFFFTILGTVIGAVTGGLDAWAKGDNIWTGIAAGAVSGAISGAGIDIGTAVTAATGGTGLGVGLAIAATFGALSGVVGTGISTNWEADPLEYVASALVSGLMNTISFGAAPISGEIAKGTVTSIMKGLFNEGIKDIGLNIAYGVILAEGGIWITRALTQDYALSRIKVTR